MFYNNRTVRKLILYLIFSLFIVWLVLYPEIPLVWEDGVLLILFLALVHSVIENQYILNKLSKKYDAQSKILSSVFKYGTFSNLSDNIFTTKLKDIEKDVKCEDARSALYDGINKCKNCSRSKANGGDCQDEGSCNLIYEHLSVLNAQLTCVMDNLPFIVYIKDLDGRIIVANKRLEQRLQMPFSQIIGQRPEDIFLIDFVNATKYDDFSVVKNKESISVEILSRRFNSSGNWFRVIKSPIIGLGENVLGVLVIIKNIDNEKDLEIQRDNFVATLTHDLKTPTRAQLTAIDLLLNGQLGSLSAAQEELLVQVKNSNVYMFNMITTILDAYKYESTRPQLEFSSFDFSELVNETCRELTSLAETREQEIIFSAPVGNNIVLADKLQVKRVITNLISNAIIHGFEKTKIYVSVVDENKNVLFSVKNNSYFINDDRMKEIFNKYKSAKYEKSNKASTGLGLYLSKDIVKRHSGEIYAKSSPENTCEFGFSIPKGANVLIEEKSAS